MTVSIIIAVKTWQKNLKNCVSKCLELDYSDFEILILPDAAFSIPHLSERVRIVPTGPVSPAQKRDLALVHARGEVLAFLDDDAYPHTEWLSCAVRNFADPEVAAVGGPAVTPPEDTLRQKASGAIYSSVIVSGSFVYRYQPKQRREIYDYPSCNLLVRASDFKELGGFNTTYWPGEDTILCLDIIKKLRKKIIYDPDALVYHHRRSVFLPHLKQIASYALHRGYFVKKYPETSLKITYFLPGIFLAGLLFGAPLAAVNGTFRTVYFLSVFFYLLIVAIFTFINGLKEKKSFTMSNNLVLLLDVFAGIILTHIAYGFFFIRGVFTGKLPEEY